MREYVTPKREEVTLEFKIDGEVFKWTKPKNASIALPILDAVHEENEQLAMMRHMTALFDWVGAGLSDEDEAKIEARLKDPDDDFDMDDLSGIAEMITEELTGVPPTSPPASGPQSEPTGSSSTAGAPVVVSTPPN